MKKYLVPLGVFASGMILNLVLFLFLGTIGDATDQLAADTADIASTFWLWTWIAQGAVVKFIIFVLGTLLVLYATAKAFLAVR